MRNDDINNGGDLGFIQNTKTTCFRLFKFVPLSGKGRPKECWQRTKSTPSASLFRTGVPMRVMIPILATTYGESVTLKEIKVFITLIYNLTTIKMLQQFITIDCMINYFH